MEGFRRTSNGISNLFHFYNVDYVVYLEGGKKSFSKEDILESSDNYTSDSEDISFWSKIFDNNINGKKFKYKSIGSKKTLKEIANDLFLGQIRNIYIAMDNEFDEILNKRLSHPNILYTHGYSYENDIWNAKTVIDVLKEITSTNVDENYINNGFNRFISDIKLGVFCDAYLFKKNLSFFERKSGILFCIDCSDLDTFPSVKKDVIEDRILLKSLKVNTVKNYAYKNKINTLKHCFGHLLADFCCRIINHYIRIKHNFNTITKDIIYRLAINRFFNEQYLTCAFVDHYKNQFSS